ncbi:MAG: hypothetical protein EBS53_14000 [Bacteroidetes bacterium]|nr:hypothetical protein [Bacteroidota bacterium]
MPGSDRKKQPALHDLLLRHIRSVLQADQLAYPPLMLSRHGTLTLSAKNTYSGGTVVEAGTLLLSGGANSMANVTGNNILVRTNATLTFGGSDTFGNHLATVLNTITAGDDQQQRGPFQHPRRCDPAGCHPEFKWEGRFCLGVERFGDGGWGGDLDHLRAVDRAGGRFGDGHGLQRAGRRGGQ